MPKTTTTNTLGLSSLPSSDLTAPAIFLAWNWFYAYCVLASRTIKQYHGIDHNGNPHQDLHKYGADAVRAGKLTQSQLEQIQRIEAASTNSTEGYILFTASVLFAIVAGVPRGELAKACSVYSVARVVYGVVYVFVAGDGWSQVRGVMWWTSNLSCLYLLWRGATIHRA